MATRNGSKFKTHHTRWGIPPVQSWFINPATVWLFNIAMEAMTHLDGLPINSMVDLSITMLNQRVTNADSRNKNIISIASRQKQADGVRPMADGGLTQWNDKDSAAAIARYCFKRNNNLVGGLSHPSEK